MMRHRVHALLTGGLTILLLCGHRTELHAQATDLDGLITSENWLVLGPFAHSFGCTDSAALLGNHIAPSHIACEYPEEDEEIEYDEAEAVSDGYLGPGDVPTWRAFDFFGGGLGDLDLQTDVTGPLDNVMSWLVTYVEYDGESATTVDLCIGSDDAVQVWVDGEMVHNNAVCRGRAPCQDTVTGIDIEPGVHRIAMGIWEAGGGWGGSLGLRQNGAPIIDGETDDWIFLGTEGFVDAPPVCFPVSELRCVRSQDGDVELTWINPPDNLPEEEIRIVSGPAVMTLPGNATSATLSANDIAPGGLVCVVNASDIPTCCRVASTDENGFINSSRWLALGPFAHSFGCGTGVGNHIAPSLIHCEYPAADEEPRSGYDPAQASTDGLHPAAPQNAAGPIWYVWDDGEDDGTLNFDDGPTGNLSLHMIWVATYVEYLGPVPTDIRLCIGSDDGVQIWMNNRKVHDRGICRGQSLSCQDSVTVTLEQRGLYCIRAGIWEDGGGWRYSLALHDDLGQPIVDGNPEWIFHGTRRPADFERRVANPDRPTDPTGCGSCISGAFDVACESGRVGLADGLLVNWSNPEDCVCAEEIRVQIDGITVATAPPDGTSAGIPDARLPDPPFEISVVNCSGFGESCSWPPGVTGEGFVQDWLHLGPFDQPGGASPGCDLMRLDYLTDGDVTELDIEPRAGDQIEPAFFQEAASQGLNPAENCAACNPDGIPTWHAFRGIGDQFDVNALVSAGDNQMSYGLFYVDVPSDVTVDVGVSSDDAIQVLAGLVGDDLVELHCHSVARGGGGQNSVQDLVPGVELIEGEWKFMVKVFEGGGGHNWRLRFERGGQPFVPGAIRLAPLSEEPPPGARLKPGDANGDGAFNLADMVAQLNFLFGGGGGLPACYLAPQAGPATVNATGLAILDYNGDGGINLADAVAGLGGLFQGAGAHVLGESCVELEGDCVHDCEE